MLAGVMMPATPVDALTKVKSPIRSQDAYV